jgi:Transposase DDE domain
LDDPTLGVGSRSLLSPSPLFGTFVLSQRVCTDEDEDRATTDSHSAESNRKNPPACDFRAYKDRNRIERMFNRLKQFRRVATRYDKTRKSFSAFLARAATKIWLPYFVNRT